MKRIAILLGLGLLCHSGATAQPSHSSTITTEGFVNTTTGIANWVNLLSFESEFSLPFELELELELLAVNNLRMAQGKSGVADNLHLFSAIEDTPSTLALMTFGMERGFLDGGLSLFVGIRNLGRDYFTSPWNSVFTSAMNGLFPSIATNFAVADAPKAAMALHAEWRPSERWGAKLTIYDGVASELWNELFRLNLRRDGVFSIGQVSYTGPKGSWWGCYNLGFTYGYAPSAYTLSRGKSDKSSRGSVWLLAEQPLYRFSSERELYMILHGAWAPKSDCDLYGGGALLCRGFIQDGDYIGIMGSRGLYVGGHETLLEVTYSYPFAYGKIQPALHRVHAARGSYTIAMLKLVVEL